MDFSGALRIALTFDVLLSSLYLAKLWCPNSPVAKRQLEKILFLKGILTFFQVLLTPR